MDIYNFLGILNRANGVSDNFFPQLVHTFSPEFPFSAAFSRFCKTLQHKVYPISLQAMTEQKGSRIGDLNLAKEVDPKSKGHESHPDVTKAESGTRPSGVVDLKIELSSQHSDVQSTRMEQKEKPEISQPAKLDATPYIEADPEMAALAERMNGAIGFSAPPVASVQVRKGYLFELEVSGPEFWKHHDNVWSNRKRKREDLREQRHGFFAADIIKYGAVDMLGPRLPNLTNEIHPLYQRDAFTGCEDEVYEQFLPALRLASLWMTQPICFQFWVTLAMGHREVDETMSSRFNRLQHRIRNDAPLTKEDALGVIKYIREISKDYRLSFTFQDNFKQHGATIFGGTNKVCDVGWSDSERPSNGLLRIFTKLSSDYYVAAKKLSQLKYPDLAQVLRFQFGLAVLLVHETCHAIELAHIRKRPDVVPDAAYDPQYEQWIGHEPYFYDSIRPELGLTWETYMFGGRILPINDRVDCLHGLCVFDWPDKNAPFDPNSREVHTIPMTYIEKMFQMSTWEQDFDLSKKDIWHIPRTGAKSIYLTHFTTMSYDEEQRIKDEEAAEALKSATEKWEQPPDKKRRTSMKGEVLIASTSTSNLDEEPPEEVKIDEDKLWEAALDYLRAQPRKPDTSLQENDSWPTWVKESLRTIGSSNMGQAGIYIAQNEDGEDESLANRIQQNKKVEKTKPKSKKTRSRNSRKDEIPQHYTVAARAVGLGSGKRR